MKKITKIFVIPQSYAKRLLAEANGSSAIMEQRLGLPNNFFLNQSVSMVKIPCRPEFKPNFPSGLEASANEFFRYGGTTSGGLPEIIMTDVPVNKTEIIDLGVYK